MWILTSSSKKTTVKFVLLYILIIFSLAISTSAIDYNFSDVSQSAWYASQVQFVSEHGLMNGTSDTTFEPSVPLTRAMLVTILYRMDGTDYTADSAVFNDVKEGTWYYNEVAWAADRQIVTGYGNGIFAPNDNITREQLAAIMYRYAVSRNYSESESANLSSFTDESSVDDWARESVEWAVATGMISGKGNGVLDPLGNATRAEIATIVQRFYEKFVDPSAKSPGEKDYQGSTEVDDYIKSTSQMIIDNPVTADTAAAASDEFFQQRLIVKTDGTDVDFSAYNITDSVKGPDNIYFLQFDSRSEARKAKTQLSNLKNVIYVEADSFLGSTASEDTNATNKSWGSEVTGANQYASYANENASSKDDVYVAVVDSGVSNHDFLNGRIADVGYDLVDNDYDPADEYFHGTHVAGTIVDCTPGLDNIKIMPVRALNENGNGSESNVANGIRYAVDHGAKVINLSLCGTKEGMKLLYLEDCIKYAISEGVCVVQAAGNLSADTANYSPVNLSEEIVVGAVDKSNQLASFSNYGDSVDLVAPGVDISSCVPGGQYRTESGTSMAAPHVTAAAVMLLLVNPAMTPKDVEDALKKNAVNLGDQYYFGAGLLNLSGFVQSNDEDSLARHTTTDGWVLYEQESLPVYEAVLKKYDDRWDLDTLRLQQINELNPVSGQKLTGTLVYLEKDLNGDNQSELCLGISVNQMVYCFAIYTFDGKTMKALRLFEKEDFSLQVYDGSMGVIIVSDDGYGNYKCYSFHGDSDLSDTFSIQSGSSTYREILKNRLIPVAVNEWNSLKEVSASTSLMERTWTVDSPFYGKEEAYRFLSAWMIPAVSQDDVEYIVVRIPDGAVDSSSDYSISFTEYGLQGESIRYGYEYYVGGIDGDPYKQQNKITTTEIGQNTISYYILTDSDSKETSIVCYEESGRKRDNLKLSIKISITLSGEMNVDEGSLIEKACKAFSVHYENCYLNQLQFKKISLAERIDQFWIGYTDATHYERLYIDRNMRWGAYGTRQNYDWSLIYGEIRKADDKGNADSDNSLESEDISQDAGEYILTEFETGQEFQFTLIQGSNGKMMLKWESNDPVQLVQDWQPVRSFYDWLRLFYPDNL